MTLDIPWTERYRPKKVSEIVGDFRDKIMAYLKDPKSIPHFLLVSKTPGTGKTTLAKAIINELDCDYIIINSSDDRKIETIREKVKSFCSTQSSKPGMRRCIFLDEADGLTRISQEALRNVMETYAGNAFFILTCVEKNTKIYLPCGFKRVQDISNENILTHINIEKNKNTIKSIKNNILKIKTLHGQEISITPEHKFLINNEWKIAKELKKGDIIDIKLESLYGRNIELETNKYSFFDKLFLDSFKQFLLQQGYFTQEIIDDINKNYKKGLLPQHIELLKKMEINKEYDIFEIMKLDDNKLKKHRYGNHISWLKQLGVLKTIGNNRHTKYIKIKEPDECYSFYDLVHIMNNKYNTNYNCKQIYNAYRTQKHSKKIEDIFLELNPIFSINSLEYEKIEAFGRLLGFMYGDGHIHDGGLQFAGKLDCLELVKKDVKLFFPNNDLEIRNNGHKNGLGMAFNLGNISISELFTFLKMPKNAKVGKCMEIPKICYNNKLLMKSFIQALFDCESTHISLTKNNKTIGPIKFGQHNIRSLLGKDKFFDELVVVFKTFFDIDAIHNYVFIDKYKDEPEYEHIKEKRMIKNLFIQKNDDVLKFMLNIGNYYEQYKIKYDYFGYLLYKINNSINNYSFLTFDEWKEKYFKENILKDEIISIVEYVGEFEVYDLSLDIIHSYISNGFISHNCNNINKVVEPIQSRCQIINFSYPKKEEIVEYLQYICTEEKMQFDKDGLQKLVDINYPSIRNCVISLQDLYVQKLPVNIDTVQPANYIFGVYWEKLKQGDWKSIKQSLMESSVDARDLNDFFWQKALQEENIKIIQLTCRNEKDIALGANPVIIVTSSLIELAK